MHHRRPTALTAALLVPTVAVLTSCGFGYKTDRVNTIAAGVNERDASVDVLGARVVAFSDGHGRLIGSFVYNDNDAEAPAMLVGLEGEVLDPVTVPEIEVGPNRIVNLAADDVESVALQGDFTAGDVITLTYAFSTNELVTADVPVVKPCGQYDDIAEPEFDAAAGEVEEPEAPDEHADEHAEEPDATYLCEHEAPHEEEEGH